VFAYAREAKSSQTVTFTPAELGIAGPAYVYDYFAGKGTLVAPGGSFSETVSSGSYYVVAPVGPSGIAFLGDAGKFVSLGDKRITQLVDDGTVQATVAFAPGEHTVTLHGYALRKPKVTASDGSVGPLSYDPASHLFNFTVSPDGGLALSLVLRSM
jgi:hypothetical protein